MNDWIYIRRTDAVAEAPILWPTDEKNYFFGKDPDDGQDWRQEEKGMTEDETVGWHHWLDGCEFDQALGAGDGQESLGCYSPWVCKESDTTEQLNWTELWVPDWQPSRPCSISSLDMWSTEGCLILLVSVPSSANGDKTEPSSISF